jgi:thermitase
LSLIGDVPIPLMELRRWPTGKGRPLRIYLEVEMRTATSSRLTARSWFVLLVVAVPVLAFGFTGASAQNAGAAGPTRSPAVDGVLLVQFAHDATASQKASADEGAATTVLSSIGGINVEKVRVRPASAPAAIDSYRRNPNVKFVEPDFIASASDTLPNDPYFPSGTGTPYGGQWTDTVIQAPKAWDVTTGSPNVITAVVDSGIDEAHPDLTGQEVPGTSIVGGSTTDTYGHGEYVAGVIAAHTNNAVGVAGVCWSCRMMPVKIATSSSATYSDIASGIVWAADHGARVINVSWGGTSASSTLDTAVSYANAHGSVVVAAAGNAGCDCPNYPAASPGAIAVAASDSRDNLMNYSNFGSWVQVAAPTSVTTTWLKDPSTGQPYGYSPVGGTSISSPVVAGVVALMLSANPNATVDQIRSALFASVDPISGVTQGGSAVNVAYGRINAYKAVLAAGGATPAPSPSPTPSTSPTPSPTPGSKTTTFSGSLTRKSGTKAYTLDLGTGPVDAKLTFTKCASLSLVLNGPDGAPIGSATGASVLVFDSNVTAGSYTYVVSGGVCSFTLTVTGT